MAAVLYPGKSGFLEKKGNRRANRKPLLLSSGKKRRYLYTIAWRYGVDFQELAGWNGISPPYTIYPGQSLRLSYPVTRVAPDTPGQEHKKASSGSSATTAKTAPEAKVAARRSSDNKET